MLGSTIQLVFWEEFSVLLAYLDHKSSTEMNSTTIMDTLGKGSSHIDDILSEVFAEESVRDNFLMFEVRMSAPPPQHISVSVAQ